MTPHVRVLGWLHIGLGALDLLVALGVFVFFAGVGAFGALLGDPGTALAGGGAAVVIGFIVALTGIPNLLAGMGLLSYSNWGRWLALLLGVVNVFKFPYGTALAGYTFWVLLNDGTRPLFRPA
ncbi:MAG TPA: hypothetical protein VML95_04620 [Longimicrobiales bacterium]|nr:hypothetical protein [Longimicrobiales bacterium]